MERKFSSRTHCFDIDRARGLVYRLLVVSNLFNLLNPNRESKVMENQQLNLEGKNAYEAMGLTLDFLGINPTNWDKIKKKEMKIMLVATPKKGRGDDRVESNFMIRFKGGRILKTKAYGPHHAYFLLLAQYVGEGAENIEVDWLMNQDTKKSYSIWQNPVIADK